ncbi:MAG TPA: TlpA disulfide reductase family protein [Spirochaetia bacterium]|nr:TlpA disulfide reductase family protein [Spirochaetia bacterium]
MRTAVIVTGVLVVVIVAAGVSISVVTSSSRAVAQATQPVTDQAAAQANTQAVAQPGAAESPRAGRIDFQPTREYDVGRVEGLPASAVSVAVNPNLLSVGSEAPNFTLSSATGKKVSLSDYRGRTVLLEFSTTWCPHCQAEAPHLKTLMQSLPGPRFAMVQVNADSEDAASLLAFDNYYGIASPSLMDPGSTPGSYYHQGSSGPVTLQYKIDLYPTFYVIDSKGRISWRGDHELPDAFLRQKLLDAAGS